MNTINHRYSLSSQDILDTLKQLSTQAEFADAFMEFASDMVGKLQKDDIEELADICEDWLEEIEFQEQGKPWPGLTLSPISSRWRG